MLDPQYLTSDILAEFRRLFPLAYHWLDNATLPAEVRACCRDLQIYARLHPLGESRTPRQQARYVRVRARLGMPA